MNGERIEQLKCDCNGHVWIIANQLIKEFNPVNGAFTIFSTFGTRVPMHRFLPLSTFVDPTDNIIYVGGIPGFLAFTPSKTLENISQDVNLYVTDVTANGTSLWFDRTRRTSEGHLIIHPDDYNITISLSSLDYENSSYIRYEHQLVGVDDHWIAGDAGENTVVYNRLGKGKYVFKARATDANGLWSNRTVSLIIERQPAWYETTIALVIYLLLAIGLIGLIVWLYKRRLQQQSENALTQRITQAKMIYFTSVSHELLTPLTIIKCLTEQIAGADAGEKHKIELLQANVGRLRRLLQQVLDFRKVESRNMKLFVEKIDIKELLQRMCQESFEPLASGKQLQFLTLFPVSPIVGYVDSDKLEKILFNLVSNAIKYTPEGRNVTLSATVDSQGYLILRVKDEGVGIDQRDQKFIFNRFYSSKRNDNTISNGIGLSLTRELIEIHHGSIRVTSQLRKGSEFTVVLPIERQCFTSEEIKDDDSVERQQLINLEESEVGDVSDNSKENLLMVEDNLELLSVMQDLLSKRYNVFIATNGVEALETVGRENIEFIVSDISMPQMDGIELCRRIKQNIATSHLIFVLLTARISTETQVESYSAGADAYLAKPFETPVLLTLLDNLRSQRENRQNQFKNRVHQLSIELVDDDQSTTDLDQEFVRKAIRMVESNISSSKLDVEFLAAGMNMSRSTLARKLKALTGQTAFEFIKGIRMRYAYRLLQTHSKTVSEVMDRVGYNDHRSFTQSFKEMFGELPSEVK